ncbi:phage tail length tape measure family protein [Brevundimonas vancanneytii]|uniref:phage tail length tape measure family protein n=1 Tax=Brevundimonas vancanneytii TaxID=1325724 RepID=UPI0034D7241F
MKNNERDVRLNVRAVDNTSPGLKKAEAALQRFASAAEKAQARRTARASADDAAKIAAENYERATEEATKFGRQLNQIKNWQWSSEIVEAPEQLAENFERAREEARRAKIALDEARAGVARFTQSGNGLATLETRMAGLGAQTTRTEGSTERLAGDLQRLNSIQTQTAARANAAAGALRNQAAATVTAARAPFLGLRPHEAQNLSYQINDLITQIASGTPPMQAFAQQGGQIAQIFPKATGAIIRFIPVIAVAAAAIAPFVSAAMKANAEAAKMSAIEETLRTSGNAAMYSAPLLARVVDQMRAMGVSANDAQKVVKTLVREAVDPTYLDRFVAVSKNAAQVWGEDFPDAAEKVTEAFTGNVDAILALDDEIGFLTATERKQIEALKESKKEAEARTKAFDIFAQRYGETADKMGGPWLQVVNNLKAAWDSFVDFVNFIDWSKLKSELNWIADKLAKITSALPGARAATKGYVEEDLWNAQTRLAKQNLTLSQMEGRGQSERELAIQRDNIRQTQGEITLLQTRLAGMSLVDGTSEITKTQPAKDTTLDPPKPPPEPDRSADDAKRKLEAQQKFLASLLEENEARAFQVSLLDETERRQQVLTALREAEKGAAAVGLTLTQAQREAIEQSVTRLYDEQKAREAIKLIDAARLDLAQKRGEVESKDAFVQRMIAAAAERGIKLNEENLRTYTEILQHNWDIEDSKRRQQALEQTMSTLEQQRAELQRQILFAQETGDLSKAAQLQEQLNGVNAALLTAIDNMTAFWQATGGPGAAAAILALEGKKDAVTDIGRRALITGKQFNDAFASTATSALDKFAQSVGEGQNVLKSLAQAFLQFAADFLRQIAQMIIQQLIFNAISAGGGGGGQGGAGGMFARFFGSKHTGGLVGHGGGFRAVNPAVFANAQRYHSGGLVGNEVPIIAKRNEEVLTEDDPRHRFNGGMGGGNVTLKNVNVLDPGDVMAAGLETEAGERSFFNFVTRNAAAIRGAIA